MNLLVKGDKQMKILITGTIIAIIGIICVLFWHKKIDSDTTWIYGIYVLTVIILLIFALIMSQQL